MLDFDFDFDFDEIDNMWSYLQMFWQNNEQIPNKCIHALCVTIFFRESIQYVVVSASAL